jgi:predicted dithiol-disulfide oxidoreductase (DUF899 family)
VVADCGITIAGRLAAVTLNSQEVFIMAVQDMRAVLAHIEHPEVVSRDQWLAARKALLREEKEHTRNADRLAAKRRALPWVKIEKPYRFEDAHGVRTLAELFDGRSQLIVYHFMFDPEWNEGCKSCSFLADHIDGVNRHLPHHDVTLLAVSRAPWRKLQGFQRRMGWQFPWFSSEGSDFNSDFHASPSDAERKADRREYNYAEHAGAGGEWPGVSVFYKNAAGEVFHTYSGYARAGDILIGAHNYLDLTPKGRNEYATMDWVRHHDRYADAPAAHACCAGE